MAAVRPPVVVAALLGLFAFAVALPGLGALEGLGHPDEQFYLSVAVDSSDAGAIAPVTDGNLVFQKPPLVFWAAQLCLRLFGRSAFAARLPGALAAGLLVAFGTLFAAEIDGPQAGLIAGALLAGSFGVIRFGRELMLDLPLAACLTLGLWGFARVAAGRGGAFAAGLATGVVSGIKGPIGLAVLALAAVVPLGLERKLSAVGRSKAFWGGLALGTALVLPWFVWAAGWHWREFLHYDIQEQYLARFETAHAQDRFNLLWGLLLYAAPFWPLAVTGAGSKRPLGRGVWAVAWLGAFYGLFLLPKEHGLHYPLLVLPAVAVFAARGTESFAARLLPSIATAAVALGLLATLAFPEVPHLACVGAAVCGLAAAILWLRRDTVWMAALATALGANVAVAALGPALGRPLLSPEAAALGRTATVALFQQHTGPYRLEAGWPRVWDAVAEDRLLGALRAGNLVLAPDHALAAVSPATRAHLAPLTQWRRTRPRLSPGDVLRALRAHDLDALGENVALYRPVGL